MLKRSEAEPAGPEPERGIGELVSELLDEGKAYARAELELAKATAKDKAAAFKVPAILFGTAVLLVLAALSGLAIGIFASLLRYVGPLAAGFITFLLFVAVAGGLAWYGAKRLRDSL